MIGLENFGRRVFFNDMAEPRRFYLLGRAYQEGARSLRHGSRLLRAGKVALPLDEEVGDGLDVSAGTLDRCVHEMEELFGVELVKRNGEGFAFSGLTEEGCRAWVSTKEFLEKFWCGRVAGC